MTALPVITDYTDSGRTEGQIKSYMTDKRAYLAGLLGTDGVPATALVALGGIGAATSDTLTNKTIDYDNNTILGTPYDVALNAGFGGDWTGTNLVVQTYAEWVMTRTGEFVGEAGYIDTVATGAAVVVDIEKNGTTIYATKPQFAVSTNAISAGVLKTDGTEDFVSGDRITFKVTQIGSTIAGQKLRFTVDAKVD